ncbi:MAG: type II secretion system F family protein [Rhodospirillaceae bacterium]
MEVTLSDMLATLSSGAGSQLAVLGLVFIAVTLAVYGTATLFGGSAAAAARRMQRSGASDRADTSGRSSLAAFMRPLERKLEPTDLQARSQLRLRLMRAGYMHPGAIGTYFALRIVLAIGLPIPLVLALPLISRAAEPMTLLMGAGGLGLFGYFLPHLWIELRAVRRAEEIRRGFPDALDLLLVCVEAGLGLDAAIARVGDEMTAAHPVLAEQMRLTSLELRAGQSREEALRNMGRRCGVDEVVAFVTLLIQSQELGTSIADSLRVYADDMRNARMMKAEERAAQLPVKLAIPLVLFMLPAFLGSIMWPVIIQVIRIVIPALEK